MFRNFNKYIFLKLANATVRKHKLRIILIFGWDWSEVLRESLYNLFHQKENVRRNTDWIRWDIGLPLFITGQNYLRNYPRWKLIPIVLRVIVSLTLKTSYQHLLICSTYARNMNTLRYWQKVSGIDLVLVTPIKSEDKQISEFLFSKGNSWQDIRVSVEDDWVSKDKVLREVLKEKLVYINDNYLKEFPYDFTEEDIDEAILKVDWENYFFRRVRSRLLADIDEKTNAKA